jgi:hypothetical protein
MRRSTAHRLTPKTSGGTATGELDITADVGKPTGTGDSNVIAIQEYEKPPKEDGTATTYPFEVGQTWQFKGRFSGTAAATANILVTLWCYDRASEQWYGTAALNFVGESLLGTVDLGNCKDMSAVLGTSHVGLEVEGLLADQDFHVMMYESGR